MPPDDDGRSAGIEQAARPRALERLGARPPGLDPSVHVDDLALCESADVGPRTRVWAFAHVMPGARIGADCNVCGHAFVESGAVVGDGVTIKNGVLVWDRVTVGDGVFLGPGVVFTNDLLHRAGSGRGHDDFLPTVVAPGATLGANVTVVCGVTIGRHALVGAGAVVAADVPDHALMVGNPARRVGWVCTCGERLDAGLICPFGHRHEVGPRGLRQVTER